MDTKKLFKNYIPQEQIRNIFSRLDAIPKDVLEQQKYDRRTIFHRWFYQDEFVKVEHRIAWLRFYQDEFPVIRDLINNTILDELGPGYELDLTFNVGKYVVGSSIDKHVDAVVITEQNQHGMVLMLQECDSGGNFYFNEGIVDFNSGDMLFFRKDVEHGVTEILEGERFIIACRIEKRIVA